MSRVLIEVTPLGRKAFQPDTMINMERAIDKAIVFACCLASLVVLPWDPLLVVALLCAVAASALAEVVPERFLEVPACAYALASLVLLPLSVFLPLVVYDMVRSERAGVRVVWILPLCAAFMHLPFAASQVMVVACVLACLLSLRMQRSVSEQAAFRRRRDDLQESSLILEQKNRGLHEKQDLEVRLATLAERGRIAREIHDNVGHLLTRSIMQVEALQVVHRDEPVVKQELAQVGQTLHEAMGTVRSSVHDLHDDAFDLDMQLAVIAQACAPLMVEVEYRADQVPTDAGYGLVAIVREALSNAVKHSDATRVLVCLVEYPAFYRLTIHDNGSHRPKPGVFDAAKEGSSARGIGLKTMADRVRALRGSFRVDYDNGFKVFVSIPKEESS